MTKPATPRAPRRKATFPCLRWALIDRHGSFISLSESQREARFWAKFDGLSVVRVRLVVVGKKPRSKA